MPRRQEGSWTGCWACCERYRSNRASRPLKGSIQNVLAAGSSTHLSHRNGTIGYFDKPKVDFIVRLPHAWHAPVDGVRAYVAACQRRTRGEAARGEKQQILPALARRTVLLILLPPKNMEPVFAPAPLPDIPMPDFYHRTPSGKATGKKQPEKRNRKKGTGKKEPEKAAKNPIHRSHNQKLLFNASRCRHEGGRHENRKTAVTAVKDVKDVKAVTAATTATAATAARNKR